MSIFSAALKRGYPSSGCKLGVISGGWPCTLVKATGSLNSPVLSTVRVNVAVSPCCIVRSSGEG